MKSKDLILFSYGSAELEVGVEVEARVDDVPGSELAELVAPPLLQADSPNTIVNKQIVFIELFIFGVLLNMAQL